MDSRASIGDDSTACLLSFSLGPVQSFIASARSVRDLWTGSYLLSWLTFRAMQPLLDQHGTEAILTPALEGNPLLVRVERRDRDRSSACLPNRFLAVVPGDPEGTVARGLASECEASCRAAWKHVCDAVRAGLDERARDLDPDWDRLWDAQVDDFFEIRTAILPLAACGEGTLRHLLGSSFDASRPHKLWWGRLQLAARLIEAKRASGHVPAYRAPDHVPQKCTLLGTYEQMGPAPFAESRQFWRGLASRSWGGTRTREDEGLCAVSLVKRFAWPAFLSRELPPHAGYSPDTATVAAAEWLRAGPPSIDPQRERAERGAWSGLWLHWPSRGRAQERHEEDSSEHDPVPQPEQWLQIQEKRAHQGPPPGYLAILMLDGDHLGRWLRGDWTPDAGLELNRAISGALARFSLDVVPRHIARRDGTLIYSGGDDVLAFLPTRVALACARELSQAFAATWADEVGRFGGPAAHASASIVVVHYKEDLRFALARARDAERGAKEAGRNALALAICRRSGEHTEVVLPWSLVERLESWVEWFGGDAPDRWLYTLRAEAPSLLGEGPPWEAVEAEVRRLAGRVEDRAKRIDPSEAVGFLRAYREAMGARGRHDREILADFVTLGQSASFLARGRD